MSVPIRRARGRGTAQIAAVEIANFSGGLNLDAGQFNLAKDEVAELVDMDVVGRGGVRRRRAIKLLANSHNDTFDECPRSVWSFEASNANRYVYLVARWDDSGNKRILFYSLNGGAFTPFTTSAADFGYANNSDVANITAKVRSAVAGDAVWAVWDYGGVLNARPMAFKIDNGNVLSLPNEAGVSGTNNGWTEQYDPEPGSVAGLVNGRTIAAHYGYLWVGNTVEKDLSSTVVRRPSRVRWSHPGVYDRWREDDWIDIEVGKDSDQITALVPFRDHLLVFKNRSVHAIYGDSPESFTVVNLSNEFGCVSQEAVVASPFGVYFFDRASGVWAWDGSSFRWLFSPMMSLLRDETIPADKRDNASLGWVENRLWVGVPWLGITEERGKTLVFDPAVSRTGSWSIYSVGMGPFAKLRKTDGSLLFVAGCSGQKMLQALEQPGDADELTLSGGTPVQTPIRGSFRTAWIDGSVGADKQWKRPDVVVTADGSIDLVVTAYFDYIYEEDVPRRTFYVGRTVGVTELTWAELPVDDPLTPSEWNSAGWAGEKLSTMVARGSSIGRSRALSLRFTTPSGQVLPRWSVDGLIVKFRQKRVRG